MAKLEDLYQEILIDHVNNPRGRADLAESEVDADLNNPLCGDRVRIALDWDQARVSRARFDGEGCAICMASASIAAQQALGKTSIELAGECARLQRLCRSEEEVAEGDSAEVAAVAGVRRFPMRIKCAMLPWQALAKAIASKREQAVPNQEETQS